MINITGRLHLSEHEDDCMEAYRKSSNYSAKKNNSNLRVALILERKKLH